MAKLYAIPTPTRTIADDFIMEENTLITKAFKALSPRLKELVEMLEYARPAFSQTEEDFIARYIDPLPHMQRDAFGNRFATIGKATPTIAWSCHTDTVHSEEGKQALEIDADGLLALDYFSEGSCLGADCTTGVWLMRRMILAGKPGLYIFHREEESGGIGSKWITKNNPKLVHGIQAMIALDRRGYDSVITEQSTGVTASDKFAQSLADQLGGSFTPDDGGIFTDSAFYRHLIPECTNISVGYDNQHSSRETQDFRFADHLLGLLLTLNYAELEIARDHTAPDQLDRWRHGYYGRLGLGMHGVNATAGDDSDEYERHIRDQWMDSNQGSASDHATPQVDRELVALIRRHPEAVAHLLTTWDMGIDDVYEALRDYETMTRES